MSSFTIMKSAPCETNADSSAAEDWELADELTVALQVSSRAVEETPVPVSVSVSAPASISVPTVKPVMNASVSTPTNGTNTPVAPHMEIDSVLQDALGKPRERMILFQLEDSLVRFLQDSDKSTLDMPPGLNGFHRLLAYRLAGRFQLAHSTSDGSSESGEKTITLFKTTSSATPAQLVIDFYQAQQVENNSSNTSPLSDSAAVTPAAPAPKLMVMKRNNQDSSRSSKSNKQAKEITVEDREKAYLEARARIFAESQQAAADESNNSGNNSNATTSLNSNVNSNNNSAKVSPVVSPLARSPCLSPSPEQDAELSATNGSNSAKVDVSRWTDKMAANRERPAQYPVRNKEAEKADPDFVRRSNVRPAYPTNYDYPASVAQTYPPAGTNGYPGNGVNPYMAAGYGNNGQYGQYGGQYASGNPYYTYVAPQQQQQYYNNGYYYQQPQQPQQQARFNNNNNAGYLSNQDFPPLS